MAEPRILVLVLAINKNPWLEIEREGQNATWSKSCPDNVTILRYVGTDRYRFIWKLIDKSWKVNQRVSDFSKGKWRIFSINWVLKIRKNKGTQLNLNEGEIVTHVPDIYSLIGEKTLDAFQACYENLDFDYIFRTNVSSYIDLEALRFFLKDKPRDNFYAGAIGNLHGVSFASGSGYFLSRDLVIKTLENRSFWNHNFIDDVSLGKLLTVNLDIAIKPVGRIDIDSTDLVFNKITENARKSFHYRCKAKNPGTAIEIMNSIHKINSNMVINKEFFP